MSEGLSALAQLGVTPWPIGTLEEVKAAGHDLRNVACCHPSGLDEGGGKIRGCPVWKACRFDKAKLGGFKGEGPKNVGWKVITDENTANARYAPCYTYTAVIQGNADHGAELRRQGRPGTLVRIVAQEGQELEHRLTFPYSLQGEVINQSPEMMDTLEANGIKVYRGDKMIEATSWKPTRFKMIVPKFPRPSDRDDLDFIQSMIAEEMDLEQREREFEDEFAAREFDRREHAVVPEPGEEPRTVQALAEPVRKRKSE